MVKFIGLLGLEFLCFNRCIFGSEAVRWPVSNVVALVALLVVPPTFLRNSASRAVFR